MQEEYQERALESLMERRRYLYTMATPLCERRGDESPTKKRKAYITKHASILQA